MEQWCYGYLQPSHRARALMGNLYHPETHAMDILGPFPETQRGNKNILAVGVYFTKWKKAFRLKDMEALTIANVFVNEFVCRFGVPDYLHTDQGRTLKPRFLSRYSRGHCRACCCSRSAGTATGWVLIIQLPCWRNRFRTLWNN